MFAGCIISSRGRGRREREGGDMMRVSVPYAEREVRAVYVPGQIDVSEPMAGFYRMRIGAGTVSIGIRILFGAPHDPVTGEPLDRSLRWQAFADDGELLDWDRIWPACAKHPITEAEFRAKQGRRAWAEQAAPDSAYADRKAKYDPLSRSTPLPF
jgi:hypothetical protein